MKKYFVILIATIASFTYASDAFAQEAFAGGELSARYIGDGTESCGSPLPYRFTLRLFRDDPGPGGTAFATTRNISVFEVDPMGNLANKVTGADITLNNYTLVPTIKTPCIISSTTLTDGGIYESAPIMLDANKNYVMIFGNERMLTVPNFNLGLEFNSPNNNNIMSGSRFTLASSIRTTECKVVATDADDTPIDEIVEINYGRNSMPQWITNGTFEIVQSLCEGNSYEFDLYDYIKDTDLTTYTFRDLSGGLLREETVSDELEISILSVQAGYPKGIPGNIYVSGRSSSDPFPTTFDDPYTWNPATGVITFTPELPTGQTFYTAALTIRVTEFRSGYRLEPLSGTGTDFIRIPERKRLSITDRQVRFVIGDVSRCNDNLPNITADKRNAADDAWEFDCQTDTLFFTMDEPMLVRNVSKEAPYDVRIFRGIDPLASKDQDAQAIKGIYIDPTEITPLGEFTRFGVIMEKGLGPGKYVMFFKKGDDDDTWLNLCGEFMPEPTDSDFDGNKHQVIIEVNEVFDGYVFREDDDFRVPGSQKDFCYPSDEDGFFIDALYKQKADVIAIADSFVYKYRGPFSYQAPAQLTAIQTLSTGGAIYDAFPTITVPPNYEFPNVPLITPTEGWWTIGIGLRYTYAYQGNTVVRRCYGESFTLVDYVEHPRVNTADIDLCIDEDFPVIKNLVDDQFKVYNPIGPYSPVNYSWSSRVPKGGDVDVSELISPYTSVGGQADPNDVILGGEKPNDSLILEGSAAFGIGRINQIRLEVTFPNGCVSENDIIVIKQRVEVDIKEVPLKKGELLKDTIICEGQEFRMSNSKGTEYYRQDYMSRQWYFNGQMISGATTDILPRAEMRKNGKGWYKLVVTKTTENSVCFGADSVFVNVADNLVATDPICSIVTFQDGAVRQKFYWPVVEGADQYEVRPVDGDENPLNNDGERISEVEWYEANDTYGINHWVKGKEVRLYVRAVNNEVDENAPCKYGEATLADACEILVKPVNIFTPNGDGINDFLKFDLLEVFIGSKLTVFNRWGKELYQSSNYQNNWDGGDLKDGTYFYILDIDDPSGTQDIFKGTFTIVR